MLSEIFWIVNPTPFVSGRFLSSLSANILFNFYSTQQFLLSALALPCQEALASRFGEFLKARII